VAEDVSRPAESPLPPGQQLAAAGKWPVVGERAPAVRAEPWQVSVAGLVAAPQSWFVEELRALADLEQIVDVHCVTRWSKPGVRFGGVPLRRLLDLCRPQPEARFLSFVARSARGHSTSLPLADALELGALVALTCEGKPLHESHGGPVRMVVPGRYFYKSVKWLQTVELLAEDRLGYWEAQAGYHNTADPGRQQRFLAPSLDRREAQACLARRDFAGRDLRGIDARGHDLAGLNARGSLLRDAHLEEAHLERACFDGANLSGAHLEGAVLAGGSLVNADVEGTNFRGADLRGADFTGASLLGATFCPEPEDTDAWGPARLDHTTRLDVGAVAELTPRQEAFVRSCLGA
jgi:DMSO/TMAO reductase YedYZ molybdopterin-dependent catalytic subunit